MPKAIKDLGSFVDLDQAKTKSKKKKSNQKTEDWGKVLGCFADPVGCCYVCACARCALCDIGNTMGDFKVGQKKEKASSFMGCKGQFYNYCSYDTWTCPCCIGMCAVGLMCDDYFWCLYDGNILMAYAKYANKKTMSPGPCANPACSMCLCAPCIYCLIYRELKLSPCKKVVYGAAPPTHEMARV